MTFNIRLLIEIEIVGADFEKIDEVFVTDIHTYIHTYQSDVIEPPAGVQLAVFQARLIIILQESLSPRHSSEDPCPQPHSIVDNPILRNKQAGL